MRPRIFTYNDPIKLINDFIADIDQRGLQAKLARAAGCQKSYLSQALQGKVRLTPEHAVGISMSLGFNDLERKFFLELVYLSRAHTRVLQDFHRANLASLKIQSADICKKLARQSHLSLRQKLEYFSNARLQVIHLLCTVNQGQTTQLIAEQVSIDATTAREDLTKLAEMGFVRLVKKDWVATQNYVHLPKISPILKTFHLLWRQKAIDKVDDSKSVNFSALLAIDDSDVDFLRDLLQDFIKNVNMRVKSADSKKLMCLNFDFFSVLDPGRQ